MEKSMPYTTDYVIKNIAIMKYSPQDRKKRINQRALSSFMYVAQGKYHYKSDTVDFYCLLYTSTPDALRQAAKKRAESQHLAP